MPETPSPAAAPVPVRVWDLPTRVFHWALAVAVTGAIVTGEIGEPWMGWHFRFGQSALALLLFRAAWGVVGGRWSRFASFVPSPSRLRRYLRGAPSADDHVGAGHNPLGALSVLAMLALLSAQAVTGLAADDEISVAGPFAAWAGSALSRLATHWHVAIGLVAVFVLVALHVAAIAWHELAKRSPLVRAMWTGDSALPAGTPASADTAWRRIAGLVLAAAAFAGVFGAVARWGT